MLVAMEEGVLPLSNILSSEADALDFDYMDELLLEGCWLEANGSSEIPHFDCLTPISPFEPSFSWPALDSNNGEPLEEERKRSSFPENLSISPLVDTSVEGKRWWIGPRASLSVMERLIHAVGFMKSLSGNKDVLIQVWVPVTRGGRRVLTTNNQPFSLDLNCPKLAHYREISVNFLFPADEDSMEVVGLPGRVYRNKAPEWTPDVRFFSWEEYPRVAHAHQYDVRGTLAVPILQQGSCDCLGVIEVILTKQKIQYRPELESVCKALEAVDLRSPELSSTQKAAKACDLSYQAALPEIIEVLRSACETHGLPLAQTWVPCVVQGNRGCWSSDENTKNCVAPVESACYIGDSRIKGFHEACYEYHLLKGQGIVGTAFQTNEPCFSPDVSACSKADYPLSHHARMFGLKAAVAIRLRSTCTGPADFVLEFFLPTNCNSPDEHRKMLTSVSTIIQNVCTTLRVVTDKELKEEAAFSKPLAESSEIRLGQPDSDSKQGVAFVANTSASCHSSSLYMNKTGEKRRIKAEKTITLEVLRQHFAGSLKDAARNLGVCPTTLKRICRQNGIQRWPSRKIKKVGHSLQKIQRVIDSVQGASADLQIGSFYSNFPELASPNASRTTQFSNSTLADDNLNLKPSEAQPESSVLAPPPTASLSPSSSCSQSSGSSQCCSSGAQPLSVGGQDNASLKDEAANKVLKRTRSDANLHLWNDEAKPPPRSHSHVSLSWPDRQGCALPAGDDNGQKSRERDGPRIKVTYGEDTIRFRMESNWRYKDLLHEISRRFGVDNAGGYHLKYLDDDAEWVLLTCDADLEECVDVCYATRSQTIRLAFLHDSQSQIARSFSIRGTSL
ncbi:protein NLP5-like [Salvia miltiorrhiza]|uniref:protein NLP5-like n=1 Tax=Salvia miltiorrhiza TaxID=226208 RepID=UPI0025AD58C5|nr:protein NLP5-like [Salvia miltiorrhiza]